MDNDTTVTEMQRGGSEHSSDSGLRLITPTTWDPKRLEWLWERVKETEYSFDDITRDNPNYFLGILFSPTSAFYEVGDEGLIVVRDIVPKVNAMFHSAIWGRLGPHKLLKVATQVLDQLFGAFELHRITTVAPRCHPKAARLATLMGFKFEGSMRQAFLRESIYHDMDIYGLLHDEFYKRKAVN